MFCCFFFFLVRGDAIAAVILFKGSDSPVSCNRYRCARQTYHGLPLLTRTDYSTHITTAAAKLLLQLRSHCARGSYLRHTNSNGVKNQNFGPTTTCTGSESRKKTRFPFVQKPASSAVGSDGSYPYSTYTRENVLFAHITRPPPRVSASQGTDHDKTWGVYAPPSGVLAVKFEGRRWSVSGDVGA